MPFYSLGAGKPRNLKNTCFQLCFDKIIIGFERWNTQEVGAREKGSGVSQIDAERSSKKLVYKNRRRW